MLALYAANSPEYVIALHAALSLGGSVTTIAPMATPEEAASQIADAGATWLAAGCAQLDRLPTTWRGTAVRQEFVLDAGRGNGVAPFPFPALVDSPL